MKKLLLSIVLVLCLSFQSSAMSPAFLQGVCGGSVVCDDCSGSLKFAWHMEDNDATPDVTLGHPCGCSDNDSVGAVTGSPVFSTAQSSDGSHSLHINALDEYIEFDVTTDDIIEADNVKITFDIYIVSYPSDGTNTHVIYAVDDVNNNLAIRIDGEAVGGNVEVLYKGQSTADALAVAVATGSWVSCEYQAKTAVSGNDHYLACGAASDEDDDDLVAFAATADKIKFGDQYGSEAGEYYLDNVKIYPCDRY